ncbi:hypothetical protein EP331_06530 [bacterium]|nr:MAG: hypothetical protein EP331_06530 [bacterium]
MGTYHKMGMLMLLIIALVNQSKAQSDSVKEQFVGLSYNAFLESFSSGVEGDIVYENTHSISFRYARPNMFAELRWQQFNIKDQPMWKDPVIITYDSTSGNYSVLQPSYQRVRQSNQFKLNYVSFIIGPRFELLKHIAYEIGSSIDYRFSEKMTYANFENNPYRKWPIDNDLYIQEWNFRFYNRVQAWVNLTNKFRASVFWEINIPLADELIQGQQYDTNEGKSVKIEPVKNGVQFFLNVMIEYKL